MILHQRWEFIKENKKKRKKELDQESDQEKSRTRKKTRTRPRKCFLVFLVAFLAEFFFSLFLGRVLFFSYFLVFFYKFPPLGRSYQIEALGKIWGLTSNLSQNLNLVTSSLNMVSLHPCLFVKGWVRVREPVSWYRRP